MIIANDEVVYYNYMYLGKYIKPIVLFSAEELLGSQPKDGKSDW